MKRTRSELSKGLKDILITKSLSKKNRALLEEVEEFVRTFAIPSYQLKDQDHGDRPQNVLTLKWGGLKSWHFEKPEALKLLKEHEAIGMSMSAAMQNNTPRQKEIICELIDLCDGDSIYLHWDGKHVSKEEAKAYVMNYDKSGDGGLRKVKVPKDRIS